LERVRTGNATWYYLARIGSIYARLGETEKATEMIRQLERLDTAETIGQHRYATALIYSMMGEKTKAVDNMKSAFRAGFGFTSSRYKDAFEFFALQGYPPFDEFVLPKE
jgi:tetratricopeptide (TPR) repeat protein